MKQKEELAGINSNFYIQSDIEESEDESSESDKIEQLSESGSIDSYSEMVLSAEKLQENCQSFMADIFRDIGRLTRQKVLERLQKINCYLQDMKNRACQKNEEDLFLPPLQPQEPQEQPTNQKNHLEFNYASNMIMDKIIDETESLDIMSCSYNLGSKRKYNALTYTEFRPHHVPQNQTLYPEFEQVEDFVIEDDENDDMQGVPHDEE